MVLMFAKLSMSVNFVTLQSVSFINNMVLKIIPYPCAICSNNCRGNQKSIFCDCCLKWTHLICTRLNKADFKLLTAEGKEEKWFCSICLSSKFPYNQIDDVTEFICSLFNLQYCQKLNAEIIISSQQLELMAKLNLLKVIWILIIFFTMNFVILKVPIFLKMNLIL